MRGCGMRPRGHGRRAAGPGLAVEAPRMLTSTPIFKNSPEAGAHVSAPHPAPRTGRARGGQGGARAGPQGGTRPARGREERGAALTFFTDSEMFSRIRSFTSRGSMSPPPPPRRRRFPRRGPGAAANRCGRPCGGSVVPAAGPAPARPRLPAPRSAARAPSAGGKEAAGRRRRN